MLRDAECLNSRIGGLDGAGDIGEYIVNIIKEKLIPKPSGATASGKTSSESEGKGSTDSKEEGVKSEEKDSGKAS
jgi:vacuolar protein sorting-associated protein 54